MGLFTYDADDVLEKLAAWAAVDGDEAANEDALYTFLNSAFGREAIVHKQYWNAKTRADLVVDFAAGPRVVVEVKANLSDRNEYHRLVGQVYAYLSEWKCHVVLVLCGACDPAIVKLIENAMQFLNTNSAPQVRVVQRMDAGSCAA